MMFIFTQPDTNFQNSAGYASGLICETKGKINSSTEKSWVSLLDGVKNQELRFQIRRVVIKDGLLGKTSASTFIKDVKKSGSGMISVKEVVTSKSRPATVYNVPRKLDSKIR
jgi:hypothetical protein